MKTLLRVRIDAQGRLEKDSDLLIDQLRAIDNSRLTSWGAEALGKFDLKFKQVTGKRPRHFRPSTFV